MRPSLLAAVVRMSCSALVASVVGVGLLAPPKRLPRDLLGSPTSIAVGRAPLDSRPGAGRSPLLNVEPNPPGSDLPWQPDITSGQATSRDHATALTFLTGGDPETAIALLEKGGPDGRTRSGAALSDLAASYLERGRLQADPLSDCLAFERASESVEIQRGMHEGHANRALAAVRLGLLDIAAASLRSQLEVEGDGGRVNRIHARVAGLRALRTVRQMGRGSTLIEDIDLPRLASAVLQQDASKVASLSRSIEAGIGEDLALGTTAARLRNADGKAMALARGVLVYAEARSLERAGLRAQAGATFRQAESLLDGLGDPFVIRARLGVLIFDYHSKGASVATADFERLAEAAALARWPSLESRAFWMTGLVLSGRAAHEPALDFYRKARELAHSANDAVFEASIEGLTARSLNQLGDDREAWRTRTSALKRVDRSFPPARAHTLHFEAALAAEGAGLPRLAAALLSRDAPFAVRGDPGMRAENEIVLARLRAVRLVEPDWARAEAAVSRVPDAAHRSRLENELWLSRAQTATPAAASLEDLDRTVRFFEGREASARLPEILLLRAAARLRQGQARGSRQDAERASGLLEAELRSLGPRGRGLLERTAPLIEQALTLSQIEGAGPLIEAMERFRGADLRRSRHGARGNATVASIRARLDPGSGLIWYRVTDRFLDVIRLDSTGPARRRVEISRSQLEKLVDSACGAGPGKADTTGAARRTLSGILLADAAKAPASRLVVVPDGPLWRLPFSALPLGPDAVPLGTQCPLTLAASGFDWVLRNDRRRDRRSPQALVIGDPATTSARLPRLPGASREARAVAKVHRVGFLAVAEQATRSFFLSHAPVATVIHIAAHAAPETESGGRLYLGGTNEPLLGVDIARMDLSHVQVVVLSGCSTAVGKLIPGEGPFGLARAFLAGGAHSVIATSAAIADGSVEEFAVELHRGLAAGLTPVEALRRARTGLSERDGPSAGLSFELYE